MNTRRQEMTERGAMLANFAEMEQNVKILLEYGRWGSFSNAWCHCMFLREVTIILFSFSILGGIITPVQFSASRPHPGKVFRYYTLCQSLRSPTACSQRIGEGEAPLNLYSNSSGHRRPLIPRTYLPVKPYKIWIVYNTIFSTTNSRALFVQNPTLSPPFLVLL